MLAPWKKSYDQRRKHIKKQRHLPTKACLVKAMVFPVVMYGCESWTIKNAECWRIDAFELWCWRRLSRVPWSARRSNQSILKKTNPEYSLEGLMLKLKFQYFGHLMRRTDLLGKSLMLGKIEHRRRRRQQRTRWLDSNNDSMGMNLSKLWEIVKHRGSWHAIVHGVAKSGRQLRDWMTITFSVQVNRGPQHFWHQGPVSWKTVFPWPGWGDGLGMILIRSVKPRSLACAVPSRVHAPMRI